MIKQIVIVLMAAVIGGTGVQAGGVEPAQLRCEYRENPLGIDVAKPGLSWQIALQKKDESERGIKQAAYQVLVASSAKLLAQNTGDLWDSGKVKSDQSTQVEYAGKPLLSGMQCFWKVHVWLACDSSASAEEQGEGGSQPAFWTMGLLKAEDPASQGNRAAAGWRAKWIGAPTAEKVEPAPMLRKSFSLDREVRRATAYISGLGYYEMRLNGAKVGDHVLDPKFTRYDRRVLYVTYDVTAQVRKGDNALGVMLGNGWYNYHILNAWDFDVAPWRAKPKMMLQLEVEYADGTTQTIVSDESWKYSTGPVRFDGFLSGEVYDARLEKAGWDAPGYDDSRWMAAKVVEAPKGKLSAQMVEPIRVTEALKPVKITQPKPGVYLYDFGQNMAGKVRLTVTGPAGTDVKLQYGELLHGDGTLNQGNINSFCKSGEFQTEHYILKGAGEERWQSHFMYHGFQYVQVTGFPGAPKLARS